MDFRNEIMDDQLTTIYKQLQDYRVMKQKAIFQKKDNLAIFCHRQILALKRIKISYEQRIRQTAPAVK